MLKENTEIDKKDPLLRRAIYYAFDGKCFYTGRDVSFDDMHIDHIIPLFQIVEDNNVTSVEEAISCKDIWDVNNGRTLCYDCHLETETWGFNFECYKRAVEQIDDNDNVIDTFKSIKECSDKLNIHRSSINRVCIGEYKTAKGFKFRYA